MLKSLYTDIFRPPSKYQIRDFLMSIPFFAGFKKKEMSYVAGYFHRRKFSEKEIIFAEGDVGSAMYVILEGAVSILKKTNASLQQVAVLEKGSFFGEMALLTEFPRSASARANVESVVLCLFKKDLDHIVDLHPETGSKLMRNLAKVLAQRLAHAIEAK